MTPSFSRRLLLPFAAASLVAGAGIVYAQLDGMDRGIPPVDSTSNFEVLGVEVDVTADNAVKARTEGWRRAQSEGWKMLWARTTNRPAAQAPTLSDSVLNSMVSGIIVEQEQIGPRRYIARLGVLFDRARTGQLLGVQGFTRRSAPMLVIPVMETGGAAYSFEFRNEWQAAWARFRTSASPIDYVRPSGTGADPLLMNVMQTKRRGRGWWRLLLDQYGAADIVVPEVRLRRLWPGGPAVGTFTARYGPDDEVLGRFELRAPDSAAIPAMLDAGVRGLDAIYARALEAGTLRPDPTLVVETVQPLPPPRVQEPVAEDAPAAPRQVPTGQATAFSVQVATPDAASVQQAEIAVSRIGGVTSAITTSLALGGTSVMRVTYAGDAAAFQAALQAQGWSVQAVGPTTLRISR